MLIETITAAFEMDEILYELRDHMTGLNAGRWDYIFSVSKRFHEDKAFVMRERSSVTMTTPFMRAYSELLVKTCHRRGAYAIGGMSAFIPNRHKPDVTAEALAKVTETTSSARRVTALTARGWPTLIWWTWRAQSSTRCSAIGPNQLTASAPRCTSTRRIS